MMDEVISRIPVIGQKFFEELNNESWIQCRIVGRFWCDFIDSQKLPWLRRIQIHSEQMKEFSEYWKKVLNKAPVEMVKALALATQLAFKKFPDLFTTSPRRPLKPWFVCLNEFLTFGTTFQSSLGGPKSKHL